MKHDPCSPEDWWRLPLKLRRRWWDETDYGAKAPSPELRKAIKAALEELKR